MTFNKYIYELLLDNEVVIIPDFGAFVTSVVPSRTDALTGSLLPPSKAIRFDPKIRNNDFLLLNHIAEKEGITEHDAGRKVRKICDEVLYRLDNGERVEFENTGVLYFDINKELCFEPDPEALLHLDVYGLEPVSFDVQSEQKKEIIDTGQPAVVWKKKSGYLWFLLLIPVLTGFFFIYKNLNRPVRTPEQKEIIQKPVLSDSVPAKDSVIQKVEIQPAGQANKDTIGGKKYFVIGGSFEDEENARRYIAKMEKKGFNPFVVEKKGRFYIVALDGFSSLKEAGDFKRTLERDTKDTSIWILPD